MTLIIKTNFALTRSLMIIQLLFYDDFPIVARVFCFFTFMPKRNLARKELISPKPRFEHTTIQFQSKRKTNSTNSCLV